METDLHRGGRPSKTNDTLVNGFRLAEFGIDPRLSSRAQKDSVRARRRSRLPRAAVWKARSFLPKSNMVDHQRGFGIFVGSNIPPISRIV